ncbi:MAG: flippase [Candidatus Krumholzibacteriota bacterium]|nr:flippase [Candidatus Krumholzibacteriota bacterium]
MTDATVVDKREKHSPEDRHEIKEHAIPSLEESGEGSKVESSPVIGRVLRNTLSLTGANAVSSVLAFFATAYLARVLAAEGFGILGFAQAAITYFTLFINMGFTHFGVREIARNPSSTEKYVNNIVTIRIILATVAYALLLLFTSMLSKPMTVKLVMLVLGLKLYSMTFHLRWVFQGREKMGWIALSRIAPQLLYAVSVWVLIKESSQIIRVPALQVASVTAGSLILLASYIHGGHRIRLSFDLAFWKDAFRQSLPMAASFILSQIYVNFDMIMLGFTHGEETVGYYHAAYKIIFTINLFGTYYFFSLFPNLSRVFSSSVKQLGLLLSKSMRHMIILLVPISAGGMVLAGPMIRTAFGNGYAASILPLQILIWSIAIINIRQHFSNTLIASNRQKRYLLCASLGAVTNIILNLIFIPAFGMSAAAATTLFSELVVMLTMYRETRKVISINILPMLWKPVAASTGMVAVLMIIPGWNVFLRTGFGIAVYFPILFVTRGISVKEIKAMATHLREWRRR